MKFSEKIKVAGNVITLYRFSRAQRAGSRESFDVPPSQVEGESYSPEEGRRRTLSKARSRFFDLVNLNFYDLDKFLTLTIKNPVYSTPEIANPAFKNFIDKLRKTHDRELKYIATIELQKRGVIHYHLLMKMKFIDYQKLLCKWEIGGAYIKKIPAGVDAVSRYMSKYCTKDLVFDESKPNPWKHKKTFLRSRNLRYPPLVARFKKGTLSGGFEEFLGCLLFHGSLSSDEVYNGENEHLGTFSIKTVCLSRKNCDVEGVEEEVKRYINHCLFKEESQEINYPSESPGNEVSVDSIPGSTVLIGKKRRINASLHCFPPGKSPSLFQGKTCPEHKEEENRNFKDKYKAGYYKDAVYQRQ